MSDFFDSMELIDTLPERCSFCPGRIQSIAQVRIYLKHSTCALCACALCACALCTCREHARCSVRSEVSIVHGVGNKCLGTLVLYFTAGYSRLLLKTTKFKFGSGMHLIRCFASFDPACGTGRLTSCTIQHRTMHLFSPALFIFGLIPVANLETQDMQ